jgi:DNA invertase Pin-like site-specific DNA recombinase
MIQYVTYRRVSTKEQSRSGLGLKAQDRDIKIYLESYSDVPWEVIGEFVETSSGADADRPELQKAITLAKRTKAILLVAKLDRLSRKVSFIANLMDDKRLTFKVASIPNADKPMLHMYAMMAEMERDFISKRTIAALAEKKAEGVILGNRTNLNEAGAIGREVSKGQANQFAANVLPIIDQIKSSGVETLTGIADALNNRGITTSRGGSWYPTTVKNIVERSNVE